MASGQAAVIANEVDFLALPFTSKAGIAREGSTFEVQVPWALAKFGVQDLKQGWWSFECEGEGDLSGVEIRMSTEQESLVVFRARGAAARIYIQRGSPAQLSLLISPWPGHYRFVRLRLRLLSFGEALRLLLSATRRLVRRRDSLVLISRVMRRLLARQPIGFNTTPEPVASGPVGIATPLAPDVHRVISSGAVDAFLSPGDRLHRLAFDIAGRVFERSPDLKAVYADVAVAGSIVPRPEWDEELVRHEAYVDSPIFLRRGIAGGARIELADIAARYGCDSIARIPLPLAARAHSAIFAPPQIPVPVLPSMPRVSAIIPTKYRLDLLEKCLEGLAERTGYPELEVVVVNNGSSDSRFPAVIAAASRYLDLKVIEDLGPFNFSRLVNGGARETSGEILLLLNDDVTAIAPGWLHRMAHSAISDAVGAVGVRLLYPNGSIQHAGVAMGIAGVCGHRWRGLAGADAERIPYIVAPGERMAVTGACLAVRRTVFEEVGGFDEQNFPVAFNDIDFCLRVRDAGYRNIYRGDASLIHYESQSRGQDEASVKSRVRLARETAQFLARWRQLVEGDRFDSPAFDPLSEIGCVHRADFASPSDYLDDQDFSRS